MRISTNMMYDLGVGTIQQQYSDLLKLQQQLATGRRVLTPADDPIGAARTLEVSQAQSTNEQFMTNADNAKSALEFQESVLTQISELLQDARVIAVNAGNASLSASDRASLGTELQGRYDQLLGLANITDGNGQYLFSGYKGHTQPFTVDSSGGVAYNGDQGQRLVQISASRQVPVSSSGAEVFQLIRNGNGTVVTSAAATNTGQGVVSPGLVLDPAKWESVQAGAAGFDVVFATDSATSPATITYDIIDKASNASLITGLSSATVADPVTGGARFPRTFTAGQPISFKQLATDPAPQPAPWDYGIQFSIAGNPAGTTTVGAYVAGSGDTFNLQPSRTDKDIFGTLKNLIATLTSPGSPSATGNAALNNNLNTAMLDIDQAQENLLTLRATVGATLKEVEAQRNTGEDLELQYQSTLSDLRDLDYAKAISDMTLKQANLEAAQKSFLRVQGLSLFNYINS